MIAPDRATIGRQATTARTGCFAPFEKLKRYLALTNLKDAIGYRAKPSMRDLPPPDLAANPMPFLSQSLRQISMSGE